MKTTLIAILLIFSLTTFSQSNYLKINILGAIFEDYGIGYEYEINPQIGIAIFVKKSFISLPMEVAVKFDDYPYTNYDYSSQSIALELKLYSYELSAGTKVLLKFYGRYKDETVSNLPYYDRSTKKTTIYGFNYKGIALGLEMGAKKTLYNGIFFEFSGGIGRYIGSEPVFTDEDIGKYIYESYHFMAYSEYNYFSYWDPRLQLSVGYSF